MKIEATNPKFSPVAITLESQLEVDVLYGMAGSIGSRGAVRQVTNTLFRALERYAEEEDIFKGELTVREDKNNDS